MRNMTAALLLLTAPAFLMSCAERHTEPARALHPRPAVPVRVNLAELPDGSHVVYAKDGERLMANVTEKAITGIRVKDAQNREVPIHTIKRPMKNGRGYSTEEAERLDVRPNGFVAIAPPFVPGDCALVSGGAESWWLCATGAETLDAMPPAPVPDPVPVR
jgi:hypothetical protein